MNLNNSPNYAIVTGGAGFIGSALCRALSKEGYNTTILDNFSSGRTGNIHELLNSGSRARLVRGDCKKARDIRRAISGARTVFHFASNPEVRLDRSNSATCFDENVYATHMLLEELSDSDAETIVFASSSTVYGEANVIPTPETYGPLQPISFYGASKLASEALVTAHCHTYGKTGVIVRFANIVGPRSQHGVVADFVRQIKTNHHKLIVLGNGHQSKSYLYIDDCVSAILQAVRVAKPGINLFNVGSEDEIEVRRIASIVAEEAGYSKITCEFVAKAKDGRGWNGDVRKMLLDVSRLKSKGWKPSLTSEESVRTTARSAFDSNRPRKAESMLA